MLIKRSLLFLLCCLASLPVWSETPAAYVAAVRAEIEEFQSGRFEPVPGSPWVVSARPAEGGVDGGELADFETFLQQNFRGTYILFRKLPEWKKRQIWREYARTGDEGSIRSSIFAFHSRSGDRVSKTPVMHNLPMDF